MRQTASLAVIGLLGTIVLATTPRVTRADESGVSFWLPGAFGSLSAVPVQPGWSFTTLYYHSSISAGGDKTFLQGGRIVAGVEGRADLIAYGPTYVFASPVLGGQAAISVFGAAARIQAAVDATLTGPRGNVISGHASDTRTAFTDMVPLMSLKWNHGVHNFMTYATGDVPIGAYDPARLANTGIGHGAIDGGGGYTYLNPQTGNEFSAVAGFTYNFQNPDTQYQNGADFHFDWATSRFLTKQFQIGLAGYWFQQLTGDSGPGARLGDFKSRVGGVGPQIGFLFPVGDLQGYLNIKGYREFAAENRPEGWNVWVAFALSPKADEPATAKPLIRKY